MACFVSRNESLDRLLAGACRSVYGSGWHSERSQCSRACYTPPPKLRPCEWVGCSVSLFYGQAARGRLRSALVASSATLNVPAGAMTHLRERAMDRQGVKARIFVNRLLDRPILGSSQRVA